MTQQRHNPDAVANDMSGAATNVVQAATIHGDVHFSAQPNDDISVILEYESEEIQVVIDDDDRVVPVEICNWRPGTRRLVLRARGIPSKLLKSISDAIQVSHGKPERTEVRLHCTATEPAAGQYVLTLQAMDADSDQAVSRPSNAKKVIVPARPALALTVAPESRIPAKGKYEVTVCLKNEGNTDLEGNLKVSREFCGDSRYLDPGGVHIKESESFRLSRGASIEKLVSLDVSAQSLMDRRWRLPIVATCERDDLMISPKLSITQDGWLSEIPRYANQGREWLRNSARRLHVWGGQRVHPRRGVLVSWVGAVLVVGTVLLLLVPPLFRDADSGGTSALATVDVPLPCQADESVVMLASLRQDEATHAAYLAAREISRMKNLKPQPHQSYDVQVSSRGNICQDVVVKAPPEYAYFLWIGPVPSKDASDVCRQLGKTQLDDCYPIAMR